MSALQEKWNLKYNQFCKVKQELYELDLALKLSKAVENLGSNDVVKFNWGRGDNRQNVTGTVLGTEGVGKNLRVRVFVGSGVNADIKTIRPRDITAVHSAEQEDVDAE